jgi:hypothetical protein
LQTRPAWVAIIVVFNDETGWPKQIRHAHTLTGPTFAIWPITGRLLIYPKLANHTW